MANAHKRHPWNRVIEFLTRTSTSTSTSTIMGAQPSKPSSGVNCKEIVVKNPIDDYSIPCKLWTGVGRTTTRRIRGVAVFIHGGMFSIGNSDSHRAVTEALVSELDLAVVTVNFRDGSVANHASGKALADLEAVASDLKSSSEFSHLPFGVVGSSSGGYFALSLCNALDFGEVKFCIALCPVANPHARGVYLKHCMEGTTPLSTGKDLYPVRHNPQKAEHILTNQLQYFETFKQMAVAADVVQSNLHQVPTLLILGSADANVPPQVTQNVVNQWATRTVILGGAGHELQNEPPKDPHQSYIPDMERFLTSVLKDNGGGWSPRPWCS
jgi:pimeloyl-ACP methyl ester carboxylesterase